MLTVVAALIEQNHRLLICQRPKDASFPLQWEFPGGKVRAGESLPGALVRELAEELGIEAKIGPEVYRTRYRYPELPEEIELVLFAASLAGLGGGSAPAAGSPEARNLTFEQIRWVSTTELHSYDFLPADCELVAQLACGALRLG